jgi:hypothetical protein
MLASSPTSSPGDFEPVALALAANLVSVGFKAPDLAAALLAIEDEQVNGASQRES